MTGKQIRMGKLFSNGKAVVVAADHGSYMGPFEAIDDLPEKIKACKGADAFLLMPGMAKRCADFFAQKDSPLLIVRTNWAAHYCKPFFDIYTKGMNEKLCSVEYAVSLGADLIIISLLFGTDEEANLRTITQFGEFVEDADKLGIPVIGEYIPAGGIDRYKGGLENLLLGTRACAEFGADLIKTVFVDEFDQVTKNSPIPALALGGAKTDKPVDAFEIAKAAIEKGAGGVVFGRNVMQADNVEAYLEALKSVVKDGVDPAKAEADYLAKL